MSVLWQEFVLRTDMDVSRKCIQTVYRGRNKLRVGDVEILQL